MAISNKIWLNEMAAKSADEIIEELWKQHGRGNIKNKTTPKPEKKILEETLKEKKKNPDT